MFAFEVSPGLACRAVDDLPYFWGYVMRFKMWRAGVHPRELAPYWGSHVVGAIATIAHRVRHGFHEPKPDGTASDRFTVIKDGAFVPEVAHCIEQYTCYVGADRPVMRDLAQEMLAYLRTHGLPELHPDALVTRLELKDDTLIAYVRPYVAPPRDPNWVPATVLE